MWAAFIAACPTLADATTEYSAWHFCDNQSDADELAQLVRIGHKRATAGALWSYEDESEPLPQVGEFSVITDWAGHARCIIRASSVEVVPFNEVTADFASTEGEGDGSLEYWREVHWAAFGRELSETDRVPEPGMPVVCQRFDVVFGALD